VPRVQLTVGHIAGERKQQLARELTDVFAGPDVPPDWVTLVFRHIGPHDYARGAVFPWADTAPEEAVGPGLVEITIGELEEAEKRRIATGVAQALASAGVPTDQISIHFRHHSGRDVAEEGGTFPFRPPAAAAGRVGEELGRGAWIRTRDRADISRLL
jgi:phenylpyruvate tautomerase PptA (4-oxalocrotonate tautomerase family)